MKCGKISVMALVIGAALSMSAYALNEGTHLQPRGQSKVNRALARGYMQSGTESMQKQRTQVNIGSKRAGTCVMNVGATQGSRNPKEVIVTAKEIINVCK